MARQIKIGIMAGLLAAWIILVYVAVDDWIS